MCRLFAMTGGRRRVHATFWLLDAPDSLALQSRRNPDGYGIATFEADGTVEIDKRPAAAFSDEEYAREAKDEFSTTFLAHVRYASMGALTPENTHPFARDGRAFAHNGHIEGLDRLDLDVLGQTDSERYFALVSDLIDGDVGAGLVEGARRIAAEFPLFSLNAIIATPTDLWALRYPDTHELWLLERPGGGRFLDASSAAGRIRVRSGDLADCPTVLIASEPMDENPGWSPLAPGELVHVGPDLDVTRTLALPDPPAHLLAGQA